MPLGKILGIHLRLNEDQAHLRLQRYYLHRVRGKGPKLADGNAPRLRIVQCLPWDDLVDQQQWYRQRLHDVYWRLFPYDRFLFRRLAHLQQAGLLPARGAPGRFRIVRIHRLAAPLLALEQISGRDHQCADPVCHGQANDVFARRRGPRAQDPDRQTYLEDTGVRSRAWSGTRRQSRTATDSGPNGPSRSDLSSGGSAIARYSRVECTCGWAPVSPVM